MPIESIKGGGGTVITGKSIFLAQVLATKGALSLECKGIRVRRGYSAYAVVKQMFGFRGNRDKVLEQLNTLIEDTRSTNPDQHAANLEEACQKASTRGKTPSVTSPPPSSTSDAGPSSGKLTVL